MQPVCCQQQQQGGRLVTAGGLQVWGCRQLVGPQRSSSQAIVLRPHCCPTACCSSTVCCDSETDNPLLLPACLQRMSEVPGSYIAGALIPALIITGDPGMHSSGLTCCRPGWTFLHCRAPATSATY